MEVQGVTLRKQLSLNTPSILADADELEQVFSNLFSNALFEMQEGGTLSVSLETLCLSLDSLTLETLSWNSLS